MLFNSWQFGIFFVIVFLLYYKLPMKVRWVMLLTASYYFYMCWNPELIVLILITTAVHYVAALKIEECCEKSKENPDAKSHKAKGILCVSIVFSIGILFFFKYFNFFSGSVSEVLNMLSIKWDPYVLKLILPMGISFYTFQTLSYTVDVYRGKVKAEKHIGYFALYISYFPQLVAGPIERPENLLPQLKAEHCFNRENINSGLQQMAIGFFKKIVVADTLSKGVNIIFNDVGSYQGMVLIAATVMFAFVIYCDFSGYSDIAIGCARTMGIELMENFKQPYLSKSVKTFWGGWHISLSSWFRDYVYIPLGGNRVGSFRHNVNLMITFLLSGLWHGANWTFVIWGGLHGLYLVVEGIMMKNFGLKDSKGKLDNFMRIFVVFSLVCFA